MNLARWRIRRRANLYGEPFHNSPQGISNIFTLRLMEPVGYVSSQVGQHNAVSGWILPDIGLDGHMDITFAVTHARINSAADLSPRTFSGIDNSLRVPNSEAIV